MRAASLELRARGLHATGLISDAGAAPLVPGSLEHFACERYRAYAQLPVGRTLCVQIAHPPWRARPVALQETLTPAALGLAVDAAPASAQLCEDVEAVVEHVAVPSDEEEAAFVPA